MKFIENIGEVLIILFSNLGKFILFILFFFKYLFNPKFYFKNNLRYFVNIFVSSIPIIALTGIFSGMVLALQSYTGFSRFSAESAIPNIVVLTLTRELGTCFNRSYDFSKSWFFYCCRNSNNESYRTNRCS